MFVHQDIVLADSSWLKRAEYTLDEISNLGIAGSIGVDEEGEVRGFIKDQNWLFGSPLSAPAKVQTLDDCLVIIPKRIFQRHPFDENNKSFHVFGVDYCLTIKKLGYEAYCLPYFVLHNSPCTNLKGLTQSLNFVYRKHKRSWPNIFITYGNLTRRKRMIHRLLGLLEIICRYRLRIKLVPSNLPNFSDCLDREFPKEKKIIFVDSIDKNSAQFYPVPFNIKTKKFPGSHKGRLREVYHTFLPKLKSRLNGLSKRRFDGAVLSLDIFRKASSAETLRFIRAIEKITRSKILVYKETSENTQLKDFNGAVDSLSEIGFKRAKTKTFHFFSDSAKTFHSFTKRLPVKKKSDSIR